MPWAGSSSVFALLNSALDAPGPTTGANGAAEHGKAKKRKKDKKEKKAKKRKQERSASPPEASDSPEMPRKSSHVAEGRGHLSGTATELDHKDRGRHREGGSRGAGNLDQQAQRSRHDSRSPPRRREEHRRRERSRSPRLRRSPYSDRRQDGGRRGGNRSLQRDSRSPARHRRR